ncbi:MAG TPA: hypothetical protein PKD24_05275 [Pyrinomonadaceae bacterium]|nr:hypothetical protein [Pyrinomonadaceae bacterium]HMP64962.1 hypothetical protein [Pyrinomonadaceae bacterium]
MKPLYLFLVVLLLTLDSHGQTEKVIDWTFYTKSASFNDTPEASNLKALEIVEITVDGKAVMPGQPFAAEGEWLKTFAIKLRNTSGKPISSIRMHFGLPEAKVSDTVSAGFSLEYGKELSTGIDYGTQHPIQPGQEVELIRNERHYLRDRHGIAERTNVTDFNSVVIGATVVKFEDGSVWISYKLPFPASVLSN